MEEELMVKPALPQVPQNCGPPTINLSHLIDFAVQQIYHEVTVLSELLPKKLDADRKISLVQFAHSTRMLFVKLLALVKWVKSSKKFEACASICYLLDLQSQYFVETADRLVTLSREELVLARLPQFQVSAAVDVLTQGTFCRLPLCIKERFIKEKKITPKEQAQVLFRLNQILQYRVSRLSAKLSPRIKEIRIKNGIVTMTVPGEFEVELTVLGETDNTKWTLLNIKMLVEDYEIGYGTQLAHPLQLNMVHNILQSRMDAAKNPLSDVYEFLHTFAQTLQLDVLFCQCSQLSAGRLRQKILIEKYDVKERILTVGYWVQRIAHRKGSAHVRLVPQYRVTIYGSANEDTSLKVKHSPNFPNLGQLDDRTGRLSIDRLLSETFAVRCRERLLRIRKRLEAAEPKALIALTGQATPCLCFPLLRDSVDNSEECLYISVCMSTGKVLCTISAIEESGSKEMKELEKVLYDCHSVDVLRRLLDRLKVLIMIGRYRKSVAALQVRVINEAQMAPFFSKVRSLPADRICLQFIKEEQYYLVITFKPDNNLSIEVGLFLINVGEDNVQLIELVKDLPHIAAPLDRIVTLEANTFGASNEEDDWKPEPKKRKTERSMERQLPQAVSSVDDRLSFMKVCLELDKKSIRYKSIDDEPHVGGLVLHITELSQALDKKCPEFLRKLVRCCLRLDNKNLRILWPFECCMTNAPLMRDCRKDAYGNSVCTWVQEMSSNGVNGNEGIAQSIVERLTRYLHIYEIVNKFAKAYKAHYNQYCSVVAYTYHKLILAYGAKRDQLLVLGFKATPPQEGFKLSFGQTLPRIPPDYTEISWDEDTRWNAHCLVSNILNTKFNKDKNLIELVNYLISTTVPLQALSNFSRIRFQSCKVIAQVMGIDIPHPVKLKCYLTAINEHTVRLTFGSIHLEFAFLQDQQVAVRDSSRLEPRAAGLHQFFKLISDGSAQICNEDGEKPFVTESPTPKAESLPQHFEASPAGYNSNLLSVPAHLDGGSPVPPGSPSRMIMRAVSTPIIVSHNTLVRACQYKEEGGRMRSPLDDYLSSLNYLERLISTFVVCRNGQNNAMPLSIIRDFSHDHDYVRVSVVGVQHSGFNGNMAAAPLIIFHFYIDPASMLLKLKVKYSDFGPNDMELNMIERYFSKVVLPLNNELAIMSFIQLCRMTNHGAINSIARSMNLQMESNHFNLQLVYLARDHVSVSRKFCCGVIIDSTTSYILILVSFRSQRNSRHPDRQVLKLLYCSKTNTVKQQGTTEDEIIGSVLGAANNEASRTGECPIFPSIHQLHERIASGLPIVSAPRPPSVGPVTIMGNNLAPLLNPGS